VESGAASPGGLSGREAEAKYSRRVQAQQGTEREGGEHKDPYRLHRLLLSLRASSYLQVMYRHNFFNIIDARGGSVLGNTPT
jgi:hypothetical protein